MVAPISIPQQWIQVLEQLSTMYQENKSKFLEYASSLQEGMLQLEKQKSQTSNLTLIY